MYPADLAAATRIVFAAPQSVPHHLRCALFLCAIPQPVFPANSAPTAIRPAAPKRVFVQLRSAARSDARAHVFSYAHTCAWVRAGELRA